MMYRILIVEDEENIRLGIRHIIDNMIEGWQVVGAVENGTEALTFLEKNSVELVLTDIKIPGISGLELIEKIHAEYPQVLTAVLSGYNTFNFAQTALRYDVIDYVLKPTTPEKIGNILNLAADILNKRAQKGKSIFSEEVRSELENMAQNILKALLMRDREQTDRALERLSDYCIAGEQPINFEGVTWKLKHVMLLVQQDLQKYGMRPESFKSIGDQLGRIPTLLNRSEYLSWFTKLKMFFFYDIVSGIEKKHMLIDKVVKKIQQDYASHISLASLAEEFYINPNYLSELFKKEIGRNFNDYLTHIRIENAKKLLKDPKNYKIYEIAHMVGYPNERYFSKAFKKTVGYTPNGFRNHKVSEDR